MIRDEIGLVKAVIRDGNAIWVKVVIRNENAIWWESCADNFTSLNRYFFTPEKYPGVSGALKDVKNPTLHDTLSMPLV